MSFDVKSLPKPFNIGQSDSFKRCTNDDTISFGEPSGISPDISKIEHSIFLFSREDGDNGSDAAAMAQPRRFVTGTTLGGILAACIKEGNSESKVFEFLLGTFSSSKCVGGGMLETGFCSIARKQELVAGKGCKMLLALFRKADWRLFSSSERPDIVIFSSAFSERTFSTIFKILDNFLSFEIFYSCTNFKS